MKNQKGVSLIALVITIIVVIILAAIAFNTGTEPIEKGNYSKFVSNVVEVRDAFKRAATTFKGDQAALNNEITDAQAYDYVAKGAGTSKKLTTGSGDEVLPIANVPDYTIIRKESAKEAIGIDLPVIKVNTPTNTGVEVTYAVTQSGDIFVWPPYKYDEKYYVNNEATVTGYDATSVLDVTITKDGDKLTGVSTK